MQDIILHKPNMVVDKKTQHGVNNIAYIIHEYYFVFIPFS